MKKIVSQRRKKSKVKIITRRVMESIPERARIIDGKAELIQMLIPLGLKAVNDLLQEEVKMLAGSRYRHEGGPARWGKQPGSIYLGDEKFRIEVPRVRDMGSNTELSLASYHRLQRPHQRKVKGMRYFSELRVALQREFGIQKQEKIAV